jgi:hypothetical protein
LRPERPRLARGGRARGIASSRNEIMKLFQ